MTAEVLDGTKTGERRGTNLRNGQMFEDFRRPAEEPDDRDREAKECGCTMVTIGSVAGLGLSATPVGICADAAGRRACRREGRLIIRSELIAERRIVTVDSSNLNPSIMNAV